MWKIIINLVLASLFFIFHSELKGVIGDKIIYFAIPISFSFFFYLINNSLPRESFVFNFIVFLVIFGLIYFLFNFSQNNFQFKDFIFSLIITVSYVLFQEMISRYHTSKDKLKSKESV
jgi:hypothetical protein